jgi:hypothetical protein
MKPAGFSLREPERASPAELSSGVRPAVLTAGNSSIYNSFLTEVGQ